MGDTDLCYLHQYSPLYCANLTQREARVRYTSGADTALSAVQMVLHFTSPILSHQYWVLSWVAVSSNFIVLVMSQTQAS